MESRQASSTATVARDRLVYGTGVALVLALSTLLLGAPAFIPVFLLAFLSLFLALAEARPALLFAVLLLAVASAFFADVLEPAGVAALTSLFGLALLASLDRTTLPAPLGGLALLVLLVASIVLSVHIAPGFNNVLVVPELRLSPDAAPYRVYWNLDKLMVGIALVALLSVRRDLRPEARITVPPVPTAVATIVLVIGLAWLAGLVQFDPKLPALLPWWIPSNLLITSVAEEAFFRGILLGLAVRWLRGVPYGTWIALFAVSAVFGVAHFAGGVAYVALSTVAGVGYGLVYLATGRLAWSILTHFGLNLTHIVLFTYPMLASGLSP